MDRSFRVDGRRVGLQLPQQRLAFLGRAKNGDVSQIIQISDPYSFRYVPVWTWAVGPWATSSGRKGVRNELRRVIIPNRFLAPVSVETRIGTIIPFRVLEGQIRMATLAQRVSTFSMR